ncbi:MAG: glycosyltransferase [Thermoplasmata archaeon]
MVRAESSPAVDLDGGVVAFNEERRLAPAVESLLHQELPRGVRWRTLWIVASGCTDRTAEVARSLATRHPEVRVVVQPERRGKASALGEVFREARGDYLVLLNADAIARPGAVAALLRAAAPLVPPYAVMGHPEPGGLPPAGMGTGLRLLWKLHHRMHATLVPSREGTHLSDELLLLPTDDLPPLPAEVVNDGAFIGAWTRSHGGTLAYAADARVAIEVPWSIGDHLRQRRRIHFGHRQVTELVGVAPTTFARYLLRHPSRAMALLASEVRATPGGGTALIWLASAELASMVAATWDRMPPRRNHRLWETIRESIDSPVAFDPTVARTSGSRAPSDRGG